MPLVLMYASGIMLVHLSCLYTKYPVQNNGSGPVEQRSGKQIIVPHQSINILSQTQT